MTVRVGVIGVGMIGQDHIRRISQVLTGGEVVAVNDVDAARAGQVAAGLPAATVHATAVDLIADETVDAVLVASWGAAHEEQVVAAIGAGKPVFCEKPLAPTSDACLRIMEAEMAAGRRLVQVGFMRRYDAGYQAMKATLEDGSIGAPLLMHCAHRNPSVPPYGFTTEMIISDSAVHEMDLVRWLFDEEIMAARVLKPRRSGQAPDGLQDPLILLLEMASGVLVDDELFISARYGYDVRGEVVCETGTVALADVSEVTVRGRPPRRPDSRRLARPVHPRLRRGVAGLAHRGGRGDVHRSERLGRLRRRRGHGQLPGGAAHGPAHRGVPARTPRFLRQGPMMKIALDPYMFRRVPLADLPALCATS